MSCAGGLEVKAGVHERYDVLPGSAFEVTFGGARADLWTALTVNAP
jgi:hypothetical protein